MDPKTMGEAIARIDERTANIASRQEEEIRERNLLNNRVGVLENWKSYFGGAVAVLSLVVSFIGYALKEAIHRR